VAAILAIAGWSRGILVQVQVQVQIHGGRLRGWSGFTQRNAELAASLTQH
jgi:hypothetical protein